MADLRLDWCDQKAARYAVEMWHYRVIPAIEAFLAQRGLRISPEKSKVVHISAGFNFLGANVRKYNGKLLMKPMKENTLRVARESQEIIRKHYATKTEVLIRRLNARLRGWGQQFRHLVVSKAFGYIDTRVFEGLKRWMRRRHPQKSATWRSHKYFRTRGNNRWIFSTKTRSSKGEIQHLDLV